MSHIFISYATRDEKIVQHLRKGLEAAGIHVWMDVQGLKPGTRNWEDALREAIREARAIVLAASPASRLSRFVGAELDIAEMYGHPVFPVWIHGDRWEESVTMGLIRSQRVDLRGDKFAAGLQTLVRTLRGLENAPAGSSSTVQTAPLTRTEPEPRNPYRGLLPFTEKEAGDFFGRETMVEALCHRLRVRSSRFLAIVGASGSGKSSVFMAGVLPRLKTGEDNGRWLFFDVMKPGVSPLEELALVIQEHLPDSTIATIQEELWHPSTGGLHLLGRKIARRHNKERLLLFVDQFEEVYTLTQDAKERQQFIDLLTTAVNEPGGHLTILLTLRADFLHRALDDSELVALLRQHTELIQPMSLSELKEAILRPAALPDVRLKFEPALVVEMVYALRGQAGALPLLQFTLAQLYARREGRRMTRAAYDALGGVQGAIGTHAEAVFSTLDKEAQAALPAVFLILVNIDERGEPTRKRVPLAAVTQTEAARRLVETLIVNRLLTTDRDEQNQPTVEVAHEALLRHWKRLVDWIASVTDDLRVRDDVMRAAQEWDRAGRPDYLLWNHERLAPVYIMQERLNVTFDDVTRAFTLPESERLLEEFERDKRRHRRMNLIDRLGEIGEVAVPAMVRALRLLAVYPVLQNEQVQLLLGHLKRYPARTLTLLTPLLEDALPTVRQCAADALGKIGDASSVPTLHLALKDEDEQVRGAVVYALGQIGTTPAITGLLKALHDSSELVRQAASLALEQLDTQTTTTAAWAGLKHSDTAIRRGATDMLVKAGSTAVPELIKALADKSMRQGAAETLLRIGQPAVPKLVPLLRQPDTGLRQAAAEMLLRLDSFAVEALLPLLQDPDKETRWRAADILVKIGSPAIPGLIQGLKNTSQEARQMIAMILTKTGKAAVPALCAALKDSDKFVRWSAVEILTNLGDNAVLELIAVLKDEDWNVRQGAAEALTKTGSAAVPALMNALKDDDRNLRREAAAVLGEIGAPAVNDLIEAFKYSGEEISRTAATILVKIGAPATPALIQTLDDTRPMLRREAAILLTRIGTPEAIEAVRKHAVVPELINILSTQASSEYQSKVALALNKIGTHRALQAVQDWQHRQRR